MSKSRRISRLGTELTLAAVASALVSLALYMALNTLLLVSWTVCFSVRTE
ncbi:MAG: hypothetical protein ACLTBV_28130 [Enterocloster bolteae]